MAPVELLSLLRAHFVSIAKVIRVDRASKSRHQESPFGYPPWRTKDEKSATVELEACRQAGESALERLHGVEESAERHGLSRNAAEVILMANEPSRQRCDAGARTILAALAWPSRHAAGADTTRLQNRPIWSMRMAEDHSELITITMAGRRAATACSLCARSLPVPSK